MADTLPFVYDTTNDALVMMPPAVDKPQSITVAKLKEIGMKVTSEDLRAALPNIAFPKR
jgi:hypothetical protein